MGQTGLQMLSAQINCNKGKWGGGKCLMEAFCGKFLHFQNDAKKEKKKYKF